MVSNEHSEKVTLNFDSLKPPCKSAMLLLQPYHNTMMGHCMSQRAPRTPGESLSRAGDMNRNSHTKA